MTTQLTEGPGTVPPGLPPEIALLEARIEAAGDAATLAHAELLQDCLRLRAAWAGIPGVSRSAADFTDVTLAMLLRCSETHAERLLRQATAIAALEAGFTIFQTWTVEQTAAVLEEIDGLAPELADAVVAAVLAKGRLVGPSRVRRIARRERLKVAAQDAADRREQATRQRGIAMVPGRDGQAGLWINGPAEQILQIMAALKALSEPDSPHDDRPAAARRFDALVDLACGRRTSQTPAGPGAGSSPGALPGNTQPVIMVLTPIGTCLDQSDSPGELLGHGPVDASWIRDLLHDDPLLVRVPIDPTTGSPVAGPDPPVRPGRDPIAVRQALLDMLAAPPPPTPPPPHWPGGHAPPTQLPQPRPATDPATHPATHPVIDTGAPTDSGAEPCPDPGDHADGPGPYRVPAGMRRYLDVRAPYCEWPGCHVPAVRCDHDHDLAWPHGPTCPCNLGPLCRHHHRTKQTGWTKTRHPGGSVRWTSPTGRTFTTTAQHQPAPAIERPLPLLAPMPDDDEPDSWLTYDDPDIDAYMNRMPEEIESPDPDPDRQARLAEDPWHDNTWGQPLDDPHLWIPWTPADETDPPINPHDYCLA